MKILDKAIAISLCAAMGLSLTACAKSYDGTYRASYDMTDMLEESMGGMDLDGTLEVDFILTLEKGEYEIEIDAEKFADDYAEFMSANGDSIIADAFGTDDPDELAEYAELLGYGSYDEMKEDMFSASEISADDMEYDETGKYTVSGDKITFDGGDAEGEIKDGNIVVELEDDEFGEIELNFELEK